MEIDFLTILSQAGSAGIVGAMFIAYMYFDSKNKANKLVTKDDEREQSTDEVARRVNDSQQERITVMETLIGEHCKTQESAFSAVHNGLNANATAIQNIAHEVGDMKIMLERVKTIIEERFK